MLKIITRNFNLNVRFELIHILISYFAVIAIFTVVFHLSVLAGLKFSTFALSGLFISICVLLGIFFSNYNRQKGLPSGGRGWKDRLIVSVVCASGGLLSLITFKPDGDDYAYLSSIRFYLDNPKEQLNTKIRGLFGFGEEYASFIWGNANSYEYMHGAFEWFFGLNYLLSYYTLGGVLSGVLSVFAIYYLALRFYPHSQQLIFALSLSILILLFIDETTRTFANLYFLRNFQGKVIVFTVAVPMTIAWSLDYLRKQSSKAWLCLFLLNTASIGLSLTAIFLLPAAGLLTSLYFGIMVLL